MMKIWKRCSVAVLLLLMLLSAMPLFASAAVAGFDDNYCLRFVTEPGETSELVKYYKDGAEQPRETMVWVDDPERGKVLSLDGKTQYLEIGKEQLRLPQMTFATWINFRGTADPANPEAAYWQRIFTISKDEQCYFSLSPHAKLESMNDGNGNSLDGLLLSYFYGSAADSGEDYGLNMYTPAKTGVSHFGLTQNEWHHVAVTVDDSSMKLYVDGNLLDEQLFLIPVAQMFAESMMIGGGIWGDPTLNALLDDTLLFETALSAPQITALMQSGNIAATISDPASVTTTVTAYYPTTTTTEATMNVTEFPEDKPSAPFGLPVWGFGVCVGLLALIIVLTVVINLYEVHWRKTKAQRKAQAEKDADRQKGDDHDA